MFTFFNSFTSFILLALFTFFVAFNMSSQIFSISFAISFSTSKKIYLRMNDFFVMFTKRFKSIDLLHRSKNSFFSYNWRINKLSISQTRIIFYFLFVTSKKNKNRNKLISNKQLSFVVKKLIDVERIDLKRAFAIFSTFFWISRNQRHFVWIFFIYSFSKNIILIDINWSFFRFLIKNLDSTRFF